MIKSKVLCDLCEAVEPSGEKFHAFTQGYVSLSSISVHVCGNCTSRPIGELVHAADAATERRDAREKARREKARAENRIYVPLS
jgi:hypothetical protein